MIVRPARMEVYGVAACFFFFFFPLLLVRRRFGGTAVERRDTVPTTISIRMVNLFSIALSALTRRG